MIKYKRQAGNSSDRQSTRMGCERSSGRNRLPRLMKTIGVVAGILLVIVVAFVVFSPRRSSEREPAVPQSSQVTTKTQEVKKAMKIESTVFTHNQPIPAKYTCDGQNVNPPLTFSDIPAEAKSLVLINDDPDAPAGTWVHWTVWNISPTTTQVPENSVPQGAVEGTTSFGKSGYGGPCPPSGTHRYFFKVYALDTTLSLDAKATKQDLEKAMEKHVLAQTELIGLYSRR